MKRHMIISFIMIAIFIAIPLITNASTLTSVLLTKSFGGRVIATSLPIVTCIGTGTGPITLTKINELSLYTTDITKRPKVGDYILGRVNIIPNFSTCTIYDIPYPVRTTNGSNYRISTPNTGLGY
ncbi:MAG: hypothetical protein JWL92_96 [Candidatus Nomurabacteria bacterium]|nr:hypothetical protein [Candidatus Nomurabacteria bacterium]